MIFNNKTYKSFFQRFTLISNNETGRAKVKLLLKGKSYNENEHKIPFNNIYYSKSIIIYVQKVIKTLFSKL